MMKAMNIQRVKKPVKTLQNNMALAVRFALSLKLSKGFAITWHYP